jgi:hypothetical protein
LWLPTSEKIRGPVRLSTISWCQACSAEVLNDFGRPGWWITPAGPITDAPGMGRAMTLDNVQDFDLLPVPPVAGCKRPRA